MEKTAKKILIVEDDNALSTILGVGMQGEYEVLKAVDGEDGLNKTKEHSPDVILLDVMMPKMDGMQMLKQLRKEDFGKNVPVILLTNSDDMSNMAEAMELGAKGYLIKSASSLAVISEKIREALGE